MPCRAPAVTFHQSIQILSRSVQYTGYPNHFLLRLVTAPIRSYVLVCILTHAYILQINEKNVLNLYSYIRIMIKLDINIRLHLTNTRRGNSFCISVCSRSGSGLINAWLIYLGVDWVRQRLELHDDFLVTTCAVMHVYEGVDACKIVASGVRECEWLQWRINDVQKR